MRISLAESSMSCNVALSSGSSEKYRSSSPALPSVPTISSVERRRSLTKPLSFMMRPNCSVASRNFAAVSPSSSFGMICPRHSVLKLLCIRLRSFVVLVR